MSNFLRMEVLMENKRRLIDMIIVFGILIAAILIIYTVILSPLLQGVKNYVSESDYEYNTDLSISKNFENLMEAKKAERLEKIIDNNFEYLDKYFTKYYLDNEIMYDQIHYDARYAQGYSVGSQAGYKEGYNVGINGRAEGSHILTVEEVMKKYSSK